ncbi:ATP-binding protein [Elongatibacter sediminis]|uniref:histidine kinase n=1 Tax=Elongatibacter sediminis TaxID=3119006 RepID=A0AAW9RI09_9GAMM
MSRRLLAVVAGTLATLAFIVGAVAATLYFPYQQARNRAESQLAEGLRVQRELLVRLAESPEDMVPPAASGNTRDETLLPLLAAQSLLQDIPTPVEYCVGRLDNGRPVVVLQSKGGEIDTRRLGIDADDGLAVFMQRALAGRTGTDTGPDFAGREMLGAYRWLPEFQLGLVAKLPMSEIRRPYVQAVLVNSMAWMVVALLITLGFRSAIIPIRKRLKIRESEYRAIFDGALDGIVTADAQGMIRSANPAALSMLGYRQRELVGRAVSDICAIADDHDPQSDLKQLLESELPDSSGTDREIVSRHKDGSTFPCSLRLSRIYVDGEWLAMAMLRDISTHRQTAEALRKAKESAEAVAQARARFLAEMSHEIRSPMSGVSGMLELLRSTPLDETQRQYVELAQDSASALLGVINDILDHSKIESGNLELEQVPFNPAQLLEQVAGLFRLRAEDKCLRLTVDCEDGLPSRVSGDPLRLRQILVNLVDNAIKFTDQGEVRLKLRREPGKPLGDRFNFTVEDTGSGLTHSQREGLFVPYAQAGVSTARLQGGTGLGLSISRRIVELMDGEIGVDSQPGRGSRFWFSVPLQVLPDSAPLPDIAVTHPPMEIPPGMSTAAPRPSTEDEARSSTAALACKPNDGETGDEAEPGPHVLVADDKEVNRILCEEMLAALGVRVTTVNDGQQAVDRMFEEDFDLVLMDCQMPLLDGYAASRRIRAREASEGRPRTPIIALTAHAMFGAREDCLAAGMDDHLAKPFRLAQLQSIMETWLPRVDAGA